MNSFYNLDLRHDVLYSIALRSLSAECNYDSHVSLQSVGAVTLCFISVCGLCFDAVVWKVVIDLSLQPVDFQSPNISSSYAWCPLLMSVFVAKPPVSLCLMSIFRISASGFALPLSPKVPTLENFSDPGLTLEKL